MKTGSIAIVLFLYALVLLQASFWPRFNLFSVSWLRYLNITLIFIVVFSLFEKRKESGSIAAAMIGGAFLDLYSENFFGFWTIILISSVLFVKFVLRRYVRVPSFW
jgi:Na+/proline symporter